VCSSDLVELAKQMDWSPRLSYSDKSRIPPQQWWRRPRWYWRELRIWFIRKTLTDSQREAARVAGVSSNVYAAGVLRLRQAKRQGQYLETGVKRPRDGA
jgi:hypothetical protein